MQSQTSETDISAIGQRLSECTLGNLRMAARVVTQVFDEMLQPTGIKSTQYGMLGAVAVLGPGTISRIAEKIAMDRTTFTRNIKPLESLGLVSISRGRDMRTRIVDLTATGKQVLIDGIPLWEACQERMAQALGPERRRELVENLRAVVKMVN